ncbi:MAG TPA: hypothetical protein VGH73_02910 [Thermoanaerobaculia bacterium]|jgi:hypothetical protein
MLTNRASLRTFPAVLLLIALVAASLPAQAQPSRRSGTGLQAVAAFGETGLARIWSFVANLWQPGALTKEGMSIDPNGAKGGSGVVAPAAGSSDEGTSIDPDGRR